MPKKLDFTAPPQYDIFNLFSFTGNKTQILMNNVDIERMLGLLKKLLKVFEDENISAVAIYGSLVGIGKKTKFF